MKPIAYSRKPRAHFFFFVILLLATCYWQSASAMADADWLEGANGYARGTEQAKASGKPMIVYFYTDWCPYCRKFEKSTLADPDTIKALTRFVRVRVNPEKGSRENKLAVQYGVQGYPSVYFESPATDKAAQEMTRSLQRPKEFANAVNGFADATKIKPSPKKQVAAAPVSVAISTQAVAKASDVVVTHKIYLKNGRSSEGKIISDDAKGVMLATSELGEVYFSHSEIDRIEALNSNDQS